ncbi:putative tricarboxylic transport membrane protein [Anaerovirgula multivorans]|uniref:Putative tricarboxylic transport membrane protein n=1 Tax=Anaerovirgula multivorans TaxID=312168 RepID=A0A239BAJ9_9FIRM|nr:tripartite tricarboxylate transporter permease [Anaerovirgula multivorans]SNS04468.1 putative tricarboxylic transport membrane protein [Anaerovirgula multivorans]
MLESFIIGAQAVITPMGIGMIIFGVTLGIIFGSIPGLSATMALALFLPITYSMNPIAGITLLVSLYIGGISGGLISAILTRIPGTPSSIATCFDGYPMTEKGEGAKALGVGIVFSFIGTLLSTIALIFISPWLANIAIQFGSYEYFAVAIFSMTMMAGLSGKSIVKGLMSGMFGAMFATVGMDSIGSVRRYTFGSSEMMSGFSILPVLIGLFAIAEILITAERAKHLKDVKPIEVDIKNIKGFGFSLKEFFEQKWNCLISTFVGLGIGILPGIGGGVANVLNYGVIKNKSKHPEKFGTGIIDGLVASEASNNAAIGGALVPLLALGIPGDTVTAMLLGGLTIQGISPGPLMFIQNVDVVYSIFITMILGSIAMLLIEFYGLRGFVALLKIPKYYLLPAIFVFCVIGAFGINNRIFDVWTVLLFGTMGYFFNKMEIPASPFILGFIIGPMAEINLRRGLMFSQGSFMPFITSPVAVFFLVGAVISLTFSIVSQYKRNKREELSCSN